MPNQTNKQEKYKMNPFLWFLFAIVIPLIIALILTITIASIMGFSVIDWAKNVGNNVPVVSSYITTEEEKEAERNSEKRQLQNDIAEKDATISDLQTSISDLETDIQALEDEKSELESEIKAYEEKEAEEQKETEILTDLSNSLREMDSEQAANIMQELENDTAVSILRQLSTKDRGAIMEQMESERAAELTQLFIQVHE